MTNLLIALLQAEAPGCPEESGILCEWVFELTNNQSLAESSEIWVKPLKILLIFFVAWLINRTVRGLIDRGVQRMLASHDAKAEEAKAILTEEPQNGPFDALRALAQRRALRAAEHAERNKQRTQTLGTVGRSVASLVIYTMAGLMALSEFSINLGPLIASAGILGIALGFGAQSLVRDFLTGIFMLVEDQYGVGDIVDVGDAAGVVEEVKLRTTKIRDVNGTLWHIPNGEIRRVANKSQDWARAVLDIDVAYDTDLNHAMAVIKGVADELWHESLENATILEEPEIWGVERFGADSIAIRLVLKVEPSEQWATAREVRRRLKPAFDEAGIEIPFPQRTIWINETPNAKSGLTRASAPSDEFEPKTAPEGEVPV